MILGVCSHVGVSRGLLEERCRQLLVTLIEVEQAEQKVYLLIVGILCSQ